MTIRSFREKGTEKLAAGVLSKRTRKLLPPVLHRSALKKLHILRAAYAVSDLRNFPGLKLERLKGKRKDEYSIRINDQFRICFRWEAGDSFDVTVEDYH